MGTKTLFFLFALQLVFSNYTFSQEKDSSGIYVMNVDFDLLTFASVPCDRFASGFPTLMKHKRIVNKDSLVLLDSFLEKVKYKRKNIGINVRGQINYFKAGQPRISICMNDNAIMVDGRLIKQNDKFIAFLRSMTF